MGYVLAFLALSIVITTAVFFGSRKRDRSENAFFIGIVCSIVSGLLIIMPMIFSYCSYVDLYKEQASIRDVAAEVHAYKALASPNEEGGELKITGELTDLKYNNYQTNMASKLEVLRNYLVGYNRSLAAKRLMNKSWFWSWIIIVPGEEMKHIRMTDFGL